MPAGVCLLYPVALVRRRRCIRGPQEAAQNNSQHPSSTRASGQEPLPARIGTLVLVLVFQTAVAQQAMLRWRISYLMPIHYSSLSLIVVQYYTDGSLLRIMI